MSDDTPRSAPHLFLYGVAPEQQAERKENVAKKMAAIEAANAENVPTGTDTTKGAAAHVEAGTVAPMRQVGDVTRISVASDQNAGDEQAMAARLDAQPYLTREEMKAAVSHPSYKKSAQARAIHTARLAVTNDSTLL